MIGRHVEIRSAAGLTYRGVVRRIEAGGHLGELFELGSVDDPAYQRLVYVADRDEQVRDLDA